MSDLISRQAALNALGERPIVWTDNDDYTLGELNQYDSDRLAVETVPSAERHGKWIHDGYDFPHGVDWMHCSECGKSDVYCPATRTNFCPNCGARMDGEHDG